MSRYAKIFALRLVRAVVVVWIRCNARRNQTGPMIPPNNRLWERFHLSQNQPIPLLVVGGEHRPPPRCGGRRCCWLQGWCFGGTGSDPQRTKVERGEEYSGDSPPEVSRFCDRPAMDFRLSASHCLPATPSRTSPLHRGALSPPLSLFLSTRFVAG